MSQLHICASPSPLCSKVLLPSRLPLASASQTSCFWDAQSTPANHLGVLSISSLPLLLRATHDIGRSLYWCSKARSSHWASCHGHPAGAQFPNRRSPEKRRRRVKQAAPGRAARFAKAAPSRSPRVARFVALRSTLRATRHGLYQPRHNGTGLSRWAEK